MAGCIWTVVRITKLFWPTMPAARMEYSVVTQVLSSFIIILVLFHWSHIFIYTRFSQVFPQLKKTCRRQISYLSNDWERGPSNSSCRQQDRLWTCHFMKSSIECQQVVYKFSKQSRLIFLPVFVSFFMVRIFRLWDLECCPPQWCLPTTWLGTVHGILAECGFEVVEWTT